jgi:ribonuclease HI
MPFYAVSNGKNIGIFSNWNDCKSSVNGYKNAVYKKFDTKEEAEYFIKNGMNINEITNSNSLNTNIDDNTCNTISTASNSTSSNSTSSNSTSDYYVYTDGACSNNGKKNASAGIGIFFGIGDIRNLSKKIEGKQTNNAAELSAIIETYYIIENDINKIITIVTDSEYAIKCVSTYGEKCYIKNWNIDIPNKELVKTIYELYKDKPNIKFMHIRAHTNNKDVHSIGNSHADNLANIAINLQKCPYSINKLN